MADLLTAYDDEESNVFIDCKICNKKIRGETNYKVHRTTFQHLKREEAHAAKGHIPKPHPLPEWTDIKQYLAFLNLDEPIIGLSALVQVDSIFSDDGKVLLRYKCKLCSVEMDMCSMISHVVGRRHRQKYLESKRPDLMNWSSNSQTQPGLVARAKAALVEKQEGWGTPTPLKKSGSGSRQKNQAANRPPPLLELKVTPVLGRKEPVTQAKGSHRSYLEDNTRRRSAASRQDDLYDKSYGDSRNYRDAESYPQGGRQRGSYGGDHTEMSYVREDSRTDFFPGDESFGRDYFDEAMPRPYDQHQNEYYMERSSSRKRYTGRDEPGNFYQGSSSGSVHVESGTVLHHGEMDYRGQMQDQMGPSHQGRGIGLDEMQLRERSYQFTEKGGEHFQEVRTTTKGGSVEMQDRRQSYFADDDVPAKKQRKSRFSDASPMDKALAWKSQFDDEILKGQERTNFIRTQGFGKEVDSGVINFTPKKENVLDILNDIHIESVEEANFLKEKLCTLFKEFQSTKAQHSKQTSQASHTAENFTDYGHVSDPRIDQLRDALQSRPSHDQGFQLSGRSDRDFREPHFEEDRRRFPDMRRNGKGALQESEEYERDHRDFQVPRHFEDSQMRGFEDDSREYSGTRHLDTESMRHRGSTEARHGDYERTLLDSGHHREASRRAAEERYNEGNFESQQEYGWDVKRAGTAELSQDHMTYHQDGERRVYREDLWNPRIVSEERSHAETERGQYRDDYHTGLDLYDPYHPSSSPPGETRHSSTLDKLASTLLELVARKTN